jgi:hypothetical protein
MLSRALSLGVLGLVLCCSATVGRAEEKVVTDVTIEFRDTAEVPNVRYSVKIVIEFASGRKPATLSFTTDAGARGALLAELVDAGLKGNENWDHTHKGNTVVVRSWKDPKTGTTHAVRTVTVTSPDMPKAELPRVTPAGQKG